MLTSSHLVLKEMTTFFSLLLSSSLICTAQADDLFFVDSENLNSLEAKWSPQPEPGQANVNAKPQQESPKAEQATRATLKPNSLRLRPPSLGIRTLQQPGGASGASGDRERLRKIRRRERRPKPPLPPTFTSKTNSKRTLR